MKEKIQLVVALAQKSRHCGNLWEETKMHKSCGERLRVDGCSGKGCATHLVRHKHLTSHKKGRYCESKELGKRHVAPECIALFKDQLFPVIKK